MTVMSLYAKTYNITRNISFMLLPHWLFINKYWLFRKYPSKNSKIVQRIGKKNKEAL